MKLNTLFIVGSLALSGCTIYELKDITADENVEGEDYYVLQQYDQSKDPLQSSLYFQKQLKQKLANKHGSETSSPDHEGELPQHSSKDYIPKAEHNLNHYTQGLMQDLVANLQHVKASTSLAVVSFVMLDSDYNQSSLLGNQIAESLIHEAHNAGIPVIDYKTTGYIRVTEQGDFAFSKDYEDFGETLPARFVVGGTMLKHKDGYLVNARIINFASKSVVATAQSFIPKDVADALMASEKANKGQRKAVINIKDAKPSTAKRTDSNMVPLLGNQSE